MATEFSVDQTFNEIKTGMRCVLVKGRTFFFRYPSADLMSVAHLYEQETYLKYKGKIPTTDEVVARLSRGKQYPPLSELREKEKAHQAVIDAFTAKKRGPGDMSYDFYIKELNRVKRMIREVEQIQLQLGATNNFCLDVKIRQQTYLYYLKKCTYMRKNDQFIPYFKEAKFTDNMHRNSMAAALFQPFVEFISGFTEQEMRLLARSNMVMNLYKISVNNSTPMFVGTATQYSILQTSLLFWLDYYHSVYKNIGVPDPCVLEDDAKFDNWVRSEIEERNKARNNDNSGSRNGTDTTKHKIKFSKPTLASCGGA